MTRTSKAVIACGYWLSACLKLGWSRADFDWLEALWWEHHDDHGNLKSEVLATPSDDPDHPKEKT